MISNCSGRNSGAEDVLVPFSMGSRVDLHWDRQAFSLWSKKINGAAVCAKSRSPGSS